MPCIDNEKITLFLFEIYQFYSSKINIDDTMQYYPVLMIFYVNSLIINYVFVSNYGKISTNIITRD